MDLRPTLTAPKIWRKITIKRAEAAIRVEQELEDFMPRRTVLLGAQVQEIEPHLSLGQIRDRFLGAGPATCTVHLKEDLEVIFLNLDSSAGLKISDQRYGEQITSGEAVCLGSLQIQEAVAAAETIYLQHTQSFSDPYQCEDPRKEPVTFKTGSEAALRSQITDLFHSFPRIFDKIPEPRIFVYTEFEASPASFNIHLAHAEQQWQPENYLLSLLKQIVRENTPCGYCYRSRSGQLERRSAFQKDALFLSVALAAPTREQITQARQNTSAVFQKYRLQLNNELFDQNPFQCDSERA